MCEIQKERRGRRVSMGPFDTFVRQVQNIATLFPRLSEDEQHEAVKILRQFTSVICTRFGPETADCQDDDQNGGSSSVIIVPMSEGDDLSAQGAVGSPALAGDQSQELVFPERCNSDMADTVQYVLASSPGGINSEEYCNLMITDSDGHDHVVMVRNEDGSIDELGQVILANNTEDSSAEIVNILSSLTEEMGRSLASPGYDIDSSIPTEATYDKVDAEKTSFSTPDSDKEQTPLVQKIVVEVDQKIKPQDNSERLHDCALDLDIGVIKSIDDIISVKIEHERVQDQSEPERPEPCHQEKIPAIHGNQIRPRSNRKVSGPKLDRENSDQSDSSPVETGVDSVDDITMDSEPGVPSDTEAEEDVPVKRRRGRPKGTFRGRKPIAQGTCEICGKTIQNASNLKVHMRVHTGDRPYKCQYCEERFTTFGNRSRHEAAHLGEKKHSCPVCGRGFLEKKSMIMHLRRHTGEKPYNCDVCGQSFRQTTSLKMHQARHTGVKNYKCTQCDKSFTQKSGLTQHMKRHGAGMNIPCPDCNKIFHTEELMLKHRTRHLNGPTFKCVLCSTSAISKTQLVDHMKTFHGEGGLRVFNCLPCGKVYSNKLELQEHFSSGVHSVAVPSANPAGVFQLFQGGLEIQEIAEVEMANIKQEIPFDLDMDTELQVMELEDESHTGRRPHKFTSPISGQPMRYRKDALPNSILSKLSGVSGMHNLVLSDGGNKIIVLKDMPTKQTQ